MTGIIRVQARLPTIRRLEFSSRSGAASHCDWSGHGSGTVRVSDDPDGLRFFEAGSFRPEGHARGVSFTNVYRWQPQGDRLRLFHERRGTNEAVWLFDLVASPAPDELVDAAAHLCGDDRYSARLNLDEAGGFTLRWRIRGPRKDEHLLYRYRPA